MHGKQLGNWEGIGKFPKKHLLNSWKVGAEFLENRGRFSKKRMEENTCRERGNFLKNKVVRPRKWKIEKGGEQPK